MYVEIAGRIPSKKNSKSAFVIHGRAIVVANPAYKKWHGQATKQVVAQLMGKKAQNIDTVFFTFFAPDARKTDLSNKWESVADLLVDCGVFEDDNCTVIPKIVLRYGGIDRQRPRAEVLIQTYGKQETT